MIRYLTAALLMVIFGLNSCATLGLKTSQKTETADSEAPPDMPPGLVRSSATDSGTVVEPGGNVKPKPMPLSMTPDEDIVFTDPDNPTADIPELATLLENVKRGPWEASEIIAKQRAAREGKPLLIWFTDSSKSPMCKALSQELFSTDEFGKWAEEKLVRLRVDVNVSAEDASTLDQKETLLIDRANYVTALKKRYKILGYPSLVLLNPSGEVIGRYRGYKRGDAQYFWGLIKHGEAVSSSAYQAWRAGLEKKGYREWQDRRGRKIFAKLVSYSKGTLVLIEPEGNRAQTKESSLSDQDRAWLAEQKKLRGIE